MTSTRLDPAPSTHFPGCDAVHVACAAAVRADLEARVAEMAAQIAELQTEAANQSFYADQEKALRQEEWQRATVAERRAAVWKGAARAFWGVTRFYRRQTAHLSNLNEAMHQRAAQAEARATAAEKKAEILDAALTDIWHGREPDEWPGGSDGVDWPTYRAWRAFQDVAALGTAPAPADAPARYPADPAWERAMACLDCGAAVGANELDLDDCQACSARKVGRRWQSTPYVAPAEPHGEG